MDYTTPPSYGSTVVNVGGIVRDGEILCAGSTNSAEHTEVKGDPENDWPEPGAIKLTWHGQTKAGKSVTAELSGSLGQRLDRVDVMAEVPRFVKNIVGNVAGTKPYIYQVRILSLLGFIIRDTYSWNQYCPQKRLSLKVNIDGVETIEEGTLFSEATFIS